jgi:hypothetical protein
VNTNSSNTAVFVPSQKFWVLTVCLNVSNFSFSQYISLSLFPFVTNSTRNSTLAYKIRQGRLCGLANEHPNALSVTSFLMKDSTMKARCWIVFLTAIVTNSSLKIPRPEQAELSHATVLIMLDLLTANGCHRHIYCRRNTLCALFTAKYVSFFNFTALLLTLNNVIMRGCKWMKL